MAEGVRRGRDNAVAAGRVVRDPMKAVAISSPLPEKGRTRGTFGFFNGFRW